ncbi:MAG: ABC transporter substrate-binding protein [Phycisphaerae bacterium]|nr:ABC transporter substrate-binding protein [Phycisphaerae bacterium]
MTEKQPIVLRLGHSPDPDDAFMWWPLFGIDGEPPEVPSDRFHFEQVEIDIEAANQRAEAGKDLLEITALSCGQFPRVADVYSITACGSSMGEGYGPKLVATMPTTIEELAAANARIAVPGRRTTAALTMSLRLQGHDWTPVEVPFEEVPDAVSRGDVDAGVVIHEGQLTYADDGLHLVEDLGAWWASHAGGPLPLGLNLVRSDLEQLHGPGTLAEIAGLLEASVRHALDHRQTSIEYAMRFGRGIPEDVADRFVELYVNRLTIDAGDAGRDAIRRLLTEASDAGLLPEIGEIAFLRGGRTSV